ncbi:MAG: lipoyl(octanoyl) transferase LipB [archaeon]|nr:lipoyl(octanoyl) transferase LipB [archaeon]MDA1131204.1 lipoyl(octanoyl) transferase LipB [archaeon]
MTEQRDVKIIHLGEIPYQEALDLMKELQMQRIDDQIPDTLLLLNHPEIVTVGPRATNDGIKAPQGYPSHTVDRGGGLTWHGPGQLVGYPIFKWDLEGENSVAAIISLLEKWIISTLDELGIKSSRDDRMQGVWVDDKKICSIGLSFLRWVSRHGFSINIDTPSGRVEGLAGCGLESKTTTSLARLDYQISIEQFTQSLLKNMQSTVNRIVRD